jgi:hypothetical protein
MTAFARESQPYRAETVAADGTRTPLVAHALVVVLAGDRELAIELAQPPARPGGVAVISHARDAAGARLPQSEDNVASVVLHPGASNVVHLGVRVRDDDVATGGVDVARTHHPAFALDAAGARTPVVADEVAVHVARGRRLEIVLRREPARAGVVTLRSGPGPAGRDLARILEGGTFAITDLHVQFGACNVVHLAVERRKAVLAQPR